MEELFLRGCEPPIEVINLEIFDKDELFFFSCSYGYVNICKFIINNENSLLSYWSIFKKKQSLRFIHACRRGLLEIAKLLYSSGEVNIHALDSCTNHTAFIWSCENGHLEVAKWLYSLGVNIHAQDEYAFIWSCLYGHLEIAKWLYSLGGVNIHTQNDLSFCLSCYFGHLEVAKWLCEQFEEGYDILPLIRINSGDPKLGDKLFLILEYYKFQKMKDNIKLLQSCPELKFGFLEFVFKYANLFEVK